MTRFVADEAATRAFGAELGALLKAGDVVFLSGELGAGKTTLVRGLLEGLGWRGAVRSPTFTLIQTYPTEPPILHTDLYRVTSWEGLGLEDSMEDHVLLVEWPDRAEGLVRDGEAWRVQIDFSGNGRVITATRPNSELPLPA
ncbi:tRNA (adenosine(37)-N6)-threonylcarbamoyltransferase complex ATPase subunit type 1 TsaE [bacterium]|nr:MAG: tRNA (adenosine(37)-N6)-threonylcarbamoyltransferase complex ATPase subunit type 1 TsaE [bacterium]